MDETTIYITIAGHRLRGCVEDHAENVWRDVCICGWMGGDHIAHVTEEIMKLSEPEPVPAGVVRGLSWEQLRLLEVPDAGYKGIRL